MFCRPSVVHHFQRSSSPKPLGQSNPNFIWSLSGMGEQKFVCGVWVTWPRWPPCPYMVKTLQKSSPPEPKGQWPCGLLCSIGACSNDDPRLTLTYFAARSNLVSDAFTCIWGKLLGSHLMEETYSRWPEWQKVYVYIKILTPMGLSAPALGLYTCIKTWKIMYEIRLERYFFDETCNKWEKWQGFSVDIRILSTKGCLPLPRGYIRVEKH